MQKGELGSPLPFHHGTGRAHQHPWLQESRAHSDAPSTGPGCSRSGVCALPLCLAWAGGWQEAAEAARHKRAGGSSCTTNTTVGPSL